ncbi:glucokinase [Prosthecomicrobium hirschii]|uniref:Glucokinase n=1 Tax=Prosthecodimorpha hirschii TaxID=665126 RepID=A0A0P6W6C8_9HYPH|nr:glucokinase [Prosthecomicrobium hirschii]KPL54075.1 glucokinase [Prosthecomicrobium hirschii]
MPSPDLSRDSFPFPVLVADIGGTNARFALIADRGADIAGFRTVHTADFADPIAAIESLGHVDPAPRSAVMALAAPVTGDEVALTNCPWVIRPRAMIERLGLDDVLLINDFEAQALALPSLKLDGADLIQIGGGTERASATKVVVGPGTGLGVATLVHALGLWIPVPGEGGHVSLGPEAPDETPVWAAIERIGGRVTGETILSGSGMLRLARAVAAARGLPCPYRHPEEVTAGAEAGEAIGVETLRLFARSLGRIAGDFALSSLARGGVYIAGGIPQKIERFLTDGTFRAAFEAKAPHAALVAGIPTYLVRHPRAALVGLAAYAAHPERYGLDLEGRHWRRGG